MNIRAAAKDTTLPRGGGEEGLDPVYVRKGQVVEYSVHGMYRQKEIWGEEGNEFRPERCA